MSELLTPEDRAVLDGCYAKCTCAVCTERRDAIRKSLRLFDKQAAALKEIREAHAVWRHAENTPDMNMGLDASLLRAFNRLDT